MLLTGAEALYVGTCLGVPLSVCGRSCEHEEEVTPVPIITLHGRENSTDLGLSSADPELSKTNLDEASKRRPAQAFRWS